MPYYIYDWYSILYCFLTHSDTYRSIGEFIHKTGFMKRFPYVLQIFFLGPLIKELWQRHMQKIKYKTSGSLTVPTAKE